MNCIWAQFDPFVGCRLGYFSLTCIIAPTEHNMFHNVEKILQKLSFLSPTGQATIGHGCSCYSGVIPLDGDVRPLNASKRCSDSLTGLCLTLLSRPLLCCSVNPPTYTGTSPHVKQMQFKCQLSVYCRFSHSAQYVTALSYIPAAGTLRMTVTLC